MNDSLSVEKKLFHRELLGSASPRCSVRSIYGSRRWVDDLDIVGELEGHNGCVNALSWSRDGTLLASGSDDHRVNIYTTSAGFALNTCIETGHRENIFSVKFMPHSGDRTLVSAAGDGDVRVFDVEYAPTVFAPTVAAPRPTSTPALPGHRFRVRRGWSQNMTPGKVHGSPSRVYNIHTDSVKRIVTESSPHLFLTCSEDGTVRQFDLRQPSDFYARPATQQFRGVVFDDPDERVPPLISYRRYQMELNTVSCSPTQPHYIALGGGHLHCFLHDRRMLGRDRAREAGKSLRPASSPGDDACLGGATQCVRRFQPKMTEQWDRKMQNSHITACKISDANPNELVVSWSGDGVYLFDINRSPEPNAPGLGREPWDPEERNRKQKQDRAAKRKARKRRRRSATAAASSAEGAVPGQGMVKLASLVVDLRRELFALNSSNTLAAPERQAAERKKSYDAAIRLAFVAFARSSRAISDLEIADREFFESRSREEVATSPSVRRERVTRRTLARNRRRTRAFVRAAGCVARVLGGGEADGLDREDAFMAIDSGLNDTTGPRYGFLEALVAFLDGGARGVQRMTGRIHEEESVEEETLPPRVVLERFFARLETAVEDSPVRDVDTNEEIFDSEKAMVRALRSVVELDLASDESDEPTAPEATVKRFWGDRVARAVLMKEGEGIDFNFVDRAFAGSEDDDDDGVSIGDLLNRVRHLLDSAAGGAGDTDTEMGEDDDDDDDDDDSPALEDISVENETDENDDDDSDEDAFLFRRRSRRKPVEPHAPVWEHTKVYRGHCNVRTIKDVNFYGLNDEYVVSGSDCGHLFIWDKHSTQLVQLLHGDDDTVNVAVGHPYEPLLAVSGIDYTIKLFSPDQRLQSEFAASQPVPPRTSTSTTSTTTLTQPDAEKARRGSSAGRGGAGRRGAAEKEEEGEEEEEEEEEERRPYSGAVSRRKMKDSYGIVSQNNVDNESGASGHVITVRGFAMAFAEWSILFAR